MGIGARLPYNFCHPVTPDDTHNYTQVASIGPALALRIGGAGDVALVLPNGVVRVFMECQKGEVLHIAHIRVNKTGTDSDLHENGGGEDRSESSSPKKLPLLALWVI